MHDLLRLADPSRVEGRRILIFDDVCTTGLQLDAVARFLTSNGAATVDALVLARRGWGG